METKYEKAQQTINELGRLYEDAKDCLAMLPFPTFNAVERNNYLRLHDMLTAMHDLAVKKISLFINT